MLVSARSKIRGEYMSNKSIMIVEDDLSMQHMLAASVEKAGYSVLVGETGEEALSLALDQRPDLIVLDLLLPDGNGLDVCKSLRSHTDTQGIPIIMVTSLGEQSDKVYGLDVGADDYMVKPVDVPELLARIRALFRRKQKGDENGNRKALEVNEFTVLPEHLSVSREGRSVQLTALEFKLLYQLACSPHTAFSRAELQELVWGTGHGNTERAVDVLVNRLRSKLESLPGGMNIVKTVRGIGYCFSS